MPASLGDVRKALVALGASVIVALALPAAKAEAASVAGGTDVQHFHYSYGPLPITPGGNLILAGAGLPHPKVDGYMIRFKPNLIYPDGTVPRVDIPHLPHAVFLNASRPDATVSWLPERFAATGEEKTIVFCRIHPFMRGAFKVTP